MICTAHHALVSIKLKIISAGFSKRSTIVWLVRI